MAQNGKRPRQEQFTLVSEAIDHEALRRRPSDGRKSKMSTTLPYDTRNIRWHTLEGFPHLAYHICAVDEDKRIVDILFKFDANSKIATHRHRCDYVTLVLQGELRIYRANGELKEIRPVGSYVSTPGDGEPHTEGGGDQDVIAFFSNRNVTGPVYEILDADLNTVGTLGIPEFKALLEGQGQTASAA
jgi:quercetin dioxygenase-like cupin family protein